MLLSSARIEALHDIVVGYISILVAAYLLSRLNKYAINTSRVRTYDVTGFSEARH